MLYFSNIYCLTHLSVSILVSTSSYSHCAANGKTCLQFSSLEDFQEEFKDINQEEQVARLHKMLAPHLLRSMFFPVLNYLSKWCSI